ncbi:phage portal protein [Paracoccus sp. (in: a-proteobacteria)]|uniref:phage portal protein n=1 Tax=Paracoccus sp. TaxID=267 RepID=UPI002897EBEC|nr:phage portal protein [Paracoccus sp. (in: a-proteobacteria)]
MGLVSWLKGATGLQTKADIVQPVSLVNDTGWYGPIPDAGEVVTEHSSMAVSAVWACANLISGTISSLPFVIHRARPDGYSEPYRTHPLYRVLHDSPNFDQTAVDFWDYMSLSLDLFGNAYADIIRNSQGGVIALRPVKPDSVSVTRTEQGPLRYRWSKDGRYYDRLDRNVLHIRGPGGDPLGGMSVLTFGRQSFSSAMAADRAAAGMFRNGMRPSGILSFDEWLSPENRKIAREALANEYTGAVNAGRPFIAEGGMKYQHLSITPEDAQMLETRAFSVEEICRFFGVPPVMIGHTSKTTSWPTGVEQQVLMFQKFTLRRRIKRIEQAVMMQLLSAEDRAAGVSVEFNLEGLLRGDSAARASFYRTMTQIGGMTINEVRRLENLPPVAGGDEVRMQMQNQPITEAGNADKAV